MRCEFCSEEMEKVINEDMGISYECPECGHIVDVYYQKSNERHLPD